MEELTSFITAHGWQVSGIAILGIIILGILKYANAFSNFDSKRKKLIYLIISISFSVIFSTIYLLIIKKFSIAYLSTLSAAIYALNQSFYTIYENTSLRDLCNTIVDKFLAFIKKDKQQ